MHLATTPWSNVLAWPHFSNTLIKQIFLWEIYRERSDGGERWGDEQRVRAGQWEAVMMLDCLHVTRRSRRLQSSKRRCARPTCPLLYSTRFKIRLVFPVETSPTQQNIAALETPAHEFTTLQPADATLAVSSITGKEPQVVTDRACEI